MSGELCFAAGNGNLARVKQLLQGNLFTFFADNRMCGVVYLLIACVCCTAGANVHEVDGQSQTGLRVLCVLCCVCARDGLFACVRMRAFTLDFAMQRIC